MKSLNFLYTRKKMPLMSLPVRTTIVPLGTGNVLISPGSQLNIKQLKKLTNITDIVAPNLLHCAGIPLAVAAHPNAKVWGVPGAKEKLPLVPWTNTLMESEWVYSDELPIVSIEGAPSLNEVVFFHKESKTLIGTDIVFNIIDAKGLGAWIILNLFGTYKRFGVSKLWLKAVKDKDALEKSLKKIFQFDFDNIVMAHGASVEGNGKDCLAKAFRERGFDLQ